MLEPATAAQAIGPAVQNAFVDIARAAWAATSLACLLAALILFLEGYFG